MVAARNSLYERKILRSHWLQGPVVSVGNLSAGGSGKTPFVILLGDLLKARGIKFDVLSRGYGRASRGVLLVDPGGLPQQFGDEPLLIARKLQVPVVVGEDRYRGRTFRRVQIRPATAFTGRRLSAPDFGARLRYRSGDAPGCSRPPTSRGKITRAVALIEPSRRRRASQRRICGVFSAAGKSRLARAAWDRANKCSCAPNRLLRNCATPELRIAIALREY